MRRLPSGEVLGTHPLELPERALTTKAVDIVLAVLLLLGSVIGAQLGARFAARARPEYLRLILALIVLGVAARMLLGLAWRPDEIYSVTPA